jgi:uncharacterized LabA/DUF88 family protein
LADTRLKIAVFIDFDNIEIGVKSTLGVQFDIGVVLEALRERGDVVSKIAYGDWTRAGDYSRSLTQHATKLVQRNLTPGGDKNGADINLALDALEMAFTHGHINAYVIVGGDSDFITLVEKLKQYDKQIFVVGGRAFTSMVMQRNCHEFIAYENLVGSRRSQERGRQSAPLTLMPLDQVVPLVRRALKVLADREVSPQLGLLKSTLLQLDSTFSERTYGSGSFRDFAQKLAAAGYVTLKEAGRNVLVESNEDRTGDDAAPRAVEHRDRDHRGASSREVRAPGDGEEQPATSSAPRLAEGIREVRRLFQSAQNPPRWPMYIRQAKQFLRNVDPGFDERKFGFATLVDLIRACQREGLFRIERDRQGVLRIFPGNVMQVPPEPVTGEMEPEEIDDARGNVADEPVAAAADAGPEPSDWVPRSVDTGEPEIVDGDVLQEIEAAPVVDGEEARPEPSQGRGRRSSSRGRTQSGRGARKTPDGGASTRSRKASAKPRASRGRSRKEVPSE